LPPTLLDGFADDWAIQCLPMALNVKEGDSSHKGKVAAMALNQ